MASSAKINTPPTFNGETDYFRLWKDAVQLYIDAKPGAFSDDKTKIQFALSYMSTGPAATWRGAFLESNKELDGSQTLPTWKKFLEGLDTSFAPNNVPADAMDRIRHLKQNGRYIDDYISQFQILAYQADLGDGVAAVNYFKNGLDRPVAIKTISLNPGNKLSDWFKQARTAYQILQTQRDYMQTRGTPSFPTTSRTRPFKGKRNAFTRRVPLPYQATDPNAMDIDQLAEAVYNLDFEDEPDLLAEEADEDEETEEDRLHQLVQERTREALNAILTDAQRKDLKEKRCFNCRKTGHFARECPTKKTIYRRSELPRNLDARNRSNAISRRRQASYRKKNSLYNILEDATDEEVEDIYEHFANESNHPDAPLVKDFA